MRILKLEALSRFEFELQQNFIRHPPSSSSAPEKHVERLQKEGATTNPVALNHVATQSCVRQLAKNSPNPELFIKKYEELLSKK